MGTEFEPKFFDLEPTLEPNTTLEHQLDLNQLPESALVPVPFTFEPKLTISTNHIPLLVQDAGQYNSKVIYQD